MAIDKDVLKNAMDELKALRDDTMRKVRIAEQQPDMMLTMLVENWLSGVRCQEVQVEELIRIASEEIENKCLGGCFPKNCKQNYKLRKIVARKLKEVADLTSYVAVANRQPLPLVVEGPIEPTLGLESTSDTFWSCIEDEGTGIIDIPSNRRPKYLGSNAPPPTDNGISIRMEPTTQPNIASNALLSPGSANPLLLTAPGPKKFTYEELVTATNGFSTANFLGQGGFGDVHKGVLPSGKQVAVKQLKAGSMQGEREFQAEIEIISRVHHKHLVSLVGYCISGTQMMLVYKYVPNNTLKFHLHEKGRSTMSWATRMKIALGSAKGLAYLHDDCEPKIIHRDIKAANILLDNNFVAKVADFGLAKFFPDDVTHVSTQVKGTFGYLDPDYALSEKLTDKSDVYSFGVVLLELITGRRPIYKTQSSEKENLVVWARPLLKQALEGSNFNTLVDPRLQDYNSSEMARMVACADACVRQSGVLRPRVSQIFQALEGYIPLDNLNEGIKPGDSTIYDQDGSSDYDTSQYMEDLNFNKRALKSQEQNTSEIRVPTS